MIARIGTARDAISKKKEQTELDFMIDGVLMNCAVMLKEQETEIDEISDEYLDLGNEIAKTPKIVMCKDCKYGEVSIVPWTQNHYCKRQKLAHAPGWFCADGVNRDE